MGKWRGNNWPGSAGEEEEVAAGLVHGDNGLGFEEVELGS